MKERLGLVLLAALSLSACNEQNDTGAVPDSGYSGRSLSVMGQLRPKADPSVLRQIHDEEEAAKRKREEEYMRQRQSEQGQNQGNDPGQRNLPSVNTSPISGGDLPSVNGSSTALQQQMAMANQQSNSWAAPTAPPPPPQAASYGINYTTPSPGFVPPPPAVSLSATGQMGGGYGAPPPDMNPYANPYAYMQGAPGQAPPPSRAQGSLFGAATSGAARPVSSDDDDSPKKKASKPMAIITPTGMEARSPYKQRDELRLLWKGALATSLASYNGDAKLAQGLAKIDVGLPPEASKGSLSVAQRQVDAIFKNTGAVDKKIYGVVRKVQSDLVQSYYRYLYSYNKFFLTQQQVAARKQELDCAESQTEKQRATVDLAQSQQEADSSKEDMRSSQGDLASVVGAQAARTVIKNVSGVSPSLEAIAQQADPAQGQAQDSGGEGGFGGILNVFGLGKKTSPKGDDNSLLAEAPQVASENKGKEKKEKKEKKKSKGDKEQIASKSQDAAPQASKADPVAESSGSALAVPGGPVSFELKDVKTTPRKSILRVVVKNTGADNFSFDADSISVAEGNNKLADASINSEFDSTIVQPSQEVSGTITIFGRPWNDKIIVSLSDGKRPIILHR